MFLRPSRTEDVAGVLALAHQVGHGMTSLQPNEAILAKKIAHSMASFKGEGQKPGEESYFFVLEDDEKQHLAGTAGIDAHIGQSQPFYSYKLTTITQLSTQLNKLSKHKILQVTNDLAGSTEVGSLFLQPSYRRDRLGKMISLARFLFIAAFREKFAEQVIAEMRGVHDSEGNAPFYNALPKHFFEMSFTEADYLCGTQGNQFINDLMPKYPVYASLLPKSAQRAIGQVNAASEPARALLGGQGFKYTGYVDIFDAGPTLLAQRDMIHAVQHSVLAKIGQVIELPEETPKYAVSNERFREFRCTAGRLRPESDGTVSITPRLANRIQCQVGDTVRHYAL